MSVKQALQDAGRILRTPSLGEEQVKLAVILPILRALGWDERNPAEFNPEYPVEGRRVDYALLDRGKPLVFLEAKRPGAMDAKAEKQLFNYANNRGVPLLVLTDGQDWNFYLSMAEGEPPERCFHSLDLSREGQAAEHVDFLEQHLAHDIVVSRQARRNAELRLDLKRDREKANEVLPTVWRKLLQAPDETLCKLLAERVEQECGERPELCELERFLKEFPSSTPAASQAQPAAAPHVSGTRIADKEFERFVLQALSDMGGTGRARDVIDRVGEIARSRLREFDRRPNKAGNIRWRNSVHWARKALVDGGFMNKESPKGTWEISAKGRHRLRSEG